MVEEEGLDLGLVVLVLDQVGLELVEVGPRRPICVRYQVEKLEWFHHKLPQDFSQYYMDQRFQNLLNSMGNHAHGKEYYHTRQHIPS
jgi:hypothetical protein